jgi:hypothetical protein
MKMSTNCTVVISKADNHVIDILSDFRLITVPFECTDEIYTVRAYLTNGNKLRALGYTFRKRKNDLFVIKK